MRKKMIEEIDKKGTSERGGKIGGGRSHGKKHRKYRRRSHRSY